MEHWGTSETLPLITGKHGCLSVLSWSWVISRSVPSDAASVSGWDVDLRKEAEMRIIGLDLAITSAHKAVVMSEVGKFLTPVLQVTTWLESLDGLLKRAREGAETTCPLVVVMEPTGLAWLPVAVYLLMHGDRQPS